LRVSFLIGSVAAIIGCLIGFLLNDWNVTLKITACIVVGSIIISGILNGTFIMINSFIMSNKLGGTFISGDRYRDNNDKNETKFDRDRKLKISKHLLFISIPNVIVTIIILVFN
jgi:hypothetical protein